MPLFRRVLHTGGNSIVVATPATTGSTQVMFRVTTEDGRSCCCPMVEPGCDDLTWPYTIETDLEFLMDNSAVPAVPPWSIEDPGGAEFSWDTSAEGVVVVDSSTDFYAFVGQAVRYSQFTGTPSHRIDAQFNLTNVFWDPGLGGGGGFSGWGGGQDCEIAFLYYYWNPAMDPDTYTPFATLRVAVSIQQVADTFPDNVVTGAIYEGAPGFELQYGSLVDDVPLYRMEGTAPYPSAYYYQVRLSLENNGTTVTATINDVEIPNTIVTPPTSHECLIGARISFSGLSTSGEGPEPGIFELWKFDVT